jgi:hypothetical protein
VDFPSLDPYKMEMISEFFLGGGGVWLGRLGMKREEDSYSREVEDEEGHFLHIF